MAMASNGNSFAKEMIIRRRIASIFNKREDDFPSLREYNDYLEEVEDMTVNLVEGIDVASIEAKIDKYRKENAEQISNAEARKAEEFAEALKASKGQPLHSDTFDAEIQSSQGVGIPGHYAPTTVPGTTIGQPRPTQPLPVGGTHANSLHDHATDDEETMALRAARAGGWTLDISKKRALDEALSSIWI